MVRDWFIHLTRTKKYEEFITSAVLLGELLRTRKLLYATTIGVEWDLIIFLMRRSGKKSFVQFFL